MQLSKSTLHFNALVVIVCEFNRRKKMRLRGLKVRRGFNDAEQVVSVRVLWVLLQQEAEFTFGRYHLTQTQMDVSHKVSERVVFGVIE
jgi:hypothetical protein